MDGDQGERFTMRFDSSDKADAEAWKDLDVVR